MKRFTTIACTLLLVLGSAAVWASALSACCPDRGDTMMQAMDGCASASCCVVQAPVPTRHSGAPYVKASTAVPAPSLAVRMAATAAALSAEATSAEGAPPGLSQMTPVLLC